MKKECETAEPSVSYQITASEIDTGHVNTSWLACYQFGPNQVLTKTEVLKYIMYLEAMKHSFKKELSRLGYDDFLIE